MNCNVRKRTFGHVRPAKIQIRLRICTVWSESSLGAFWVAGDAACLHVDNEDSDKTHYENTPIQTLKISPPKTGRFQTKNTNIFHISAQNIDCGYSFEPPHRGGSNEYPQSMFLSRNMKSNVYPCKPQFYCIKEGFKGVKII